jgi:hypothetical protein
MDKKILMEFRRLSGLPLNEEAFKPSKPTRALDTNELSKAEHELVMDIVRTEGGGKPMSLGDILINLGERMKNSDSRDSELRNLQYQTFKTLEKQFNYGMDFRSNE